MKQKILFHMKTTICYNIITRFKKIFYSTKLRNHFAARLEITAFLKNRQQYSKILSFGYQCDKAFPSNFLSDLKTLFKMFELAYFKAKNLFARMLIQNAQLQSNKCCNVGPLLLVAVCILTPRQFYSFYRKDSRQVCVQNWEFCSQFPKSWKKQWTFLIILVSLSTTIGSFFDAIVKLSILILQKQTMLFCDSKWCMFLLDLQSKHDDDQLLNVKFGFPSIGGITAF